MQVSPISRFDAAPAIQSLGATSRGALGAASQASSGNARVATGFSQMPAQMAQTVSSSAPDMLGALRARAFAAQR